MQSFIARPSLVQDLWRGAPFEGHLMSKKSRLVRVNNLNITALVAKLSIFLNITNDVAKLSILIL